MIRSYQEFRHLPSFAASCAHIVAAFPNPDRTALAVGAVEGVDLAETGATSPLSRATRTRRANGEEGVLAALGVTR